MQLTNTHTYTHTQEQNFKKERKKEEKRHADRARGVTSWGKWEPIKDEGVQTGCTGDGAAEAPFTQLGRVGDEPNGAVLVIGSGALWGGGFVAWGGGGVGWSG